MAESQTTEDKAIMDAAGVSKEDAVIILSNLRKLGWHLIKLTMIVPAGAPPREAPPGYSIMRSETNV
jgi:hypothetical protein